MGLRKDATYLQFRNAVPNTALAWNASGVPYHMGVFTPATSLLDGAMGLVPKPLATQQNYILSNNGWIPNTGGTGGSSDPYPDLIDNTTIDGGLEYGFHLENISNLSALVVDSGSGDSGELDIGNSWFEATVDSDFGYMSFDNSTGDSSTDFFAGNGVQMSLGGSTGLINLGKTSDTGYAGALIIDGANSLIQLQRTTVSAQVTKIEIGGSEIGTTNIGNILVTGIAGNFQGIRYAADYAAQYTDRSLVDKNFVLTQIALGGAAIINTAGVNEIPKSGSAVTIIPSGIFSTAIGSISLGTGLTGTSRYIAADGSVSDVGLKLYTKGAGVMDFAFGNGGAVLGDTAINGGRTLTVGSNSASADLAIYSKAASSAIILGNTSSTASSFRFDGSTATLSLVKSPTAGATTFDIVGSSGINATFTHGDSLRIKAGDGYDTSGNGQGGSIIVQAGIKRAGGSGVDGAITLAFRDGILNIGDPNVAGNRLVQIGSADANPSLTIRQQGTGTLNLGLVTGLINLVGSGIRMNSATGSAGQFLRYDMTWATPSTGTPFSNTASASELTKSTSSTAIEGTGTFSYTHGNLTLGTDVAANRNIYADGSSATIDLRLWPKGTSGKIMLGVTTGGLVVGATTAVGDRSLLCGSSDANASFYIQTAGTGTLHLGYSTNTVNIAAASLKMNGVAGAAGQFLRYDMTWQTPAGGLTNTAATDELMKSSGGNAVPSGVFSATAGDLQLGTGLTGATRTITAAGSVTSISLVLAAKNSANIVLASNSGWPVLIGRTDGSGNRELSVGSANTDATLTIFGKGTGTAAALLLGSSGSIVGFETATIYLGNTISLAGDRLIYAKSTTANSSIYLYPQASGHIVLATIAGAVYVGDPAQTGDRVINTGSSSTNAALTINAQGSGPIYLGVQGAGVFLGNGASTGATRYIQPAGSSTDIKLFLYPKGTQDIELAVPNGRSVIIGNASDAGPKTIEVGSSDTNADLSVKAKGTGAIDLGSGTNTYKLKGATGAAATYFHSDGTWKKPITTWVDWNSGIAPSGFSSLTLAYSRYCDEGNSCTIVIGVEGTSNAAGFTVTLPFAIASFYGTSGIRYVCYVIDGTVTKQGRVVGSGSSTTLTVDSAIGGGGWATSGTKALFIEFTYLK